MATPYISVIIPLYNKEAVVERTVNTVLNQSFSDFELIIVNDGSTDNSYEIVKGIEDLRIRLIEQSNAGPGAARNTGIKAAKAEWVIFLDADDEFLPDALEHFASLSKQFTDVDIFDCTRYVRYNRVQTIVKKKEVGHIKNVMRSAFFRHVLPGCGFSMYRSTLVKSTLYNPIIRRFEDAEWLIRLLPKARVYSDDYPVEIYDQDQAAASHPRKDIKEDYCAYLNFNQPGFWAKMCVYSTFLENRTLYPEQMRSLYPSIYKRYDLLLLYKLLRMPFVSKLFR